MSLSQELDNVLEAKACLKKEVEGLDKIVKVEKAGVKVLAEEIKEEEIW